MAPAVLSEKSDITVKQNRVYLIVLRFVSYLWLTSRLSTPSLLYRNGNWMHWVIICSVKVPIRSNRYMISFQWISRTKDSSLRTDDLVSPFPPFGCDQLDLHLIH